MQEAYIFCEGVGDQNNAVTSLPLDYNFSREPPEGSKDKSV